ncbi:class I SAM-dependent methyltransferase [Spongiactinospora rosea]|uniref:Class I SAM-dependent methyltransferase n=1 Tax=Spongiactinospora rosea TaxID=2248750 RepID=A0A366LN26_9ACTN|nr:class I SAM-dependent methyltransferase [Spongiactinospora rosea]RBQ15301.1 class I SAM-dependent methyltransferase [Spongiactinospora rosea]
MPDPMTLSEFHFDANYRGDSIYAEDSPLHAIYRDVVPWDIGGPQPVVVALEAEGAFRGEVLDVGCGLGDNTLFLAGRGHRVTALDVSPKAIERAGERARSLGLEITFVVTDAVTLRSLEGRAYDTVIDSALYHGLDPEQRRKYAAALHGVTAPGARLHIACFSDEVPREILAPNRCSEQDIRRTLTDAGWSITRFDRATYTASPDFTRDLLHRIVEAMNVADGASFVEGLPADDQGRLLLPIWQVSAERV